MDTPETFATPADWQAWLAAHQSEPGGVWLKIGKAGAATPTLSYQEALEIALCYGWIDAQKRPFDEAYWLQRFTPRRGRSRWSKVNREKAERLMAEGRMQAAGLAEIERAKADGRWAAAYDSPRSATVPDDLQQALDANPEAKAFFGTINSANRYAILYRVQEAKRPETRAARIAHFVAMLEGHQTLH